MKKVIASILLTVCSTSLIVSQNSQNDWDKLGLKGKVRTTKVRFYDAMGDNGAFTKGNANSGDSNNYENIDTEFDESGNIKTLSRLRFQDGSIVEKDFYKYENGKLIEISTNDSKGNPSKKRVFDYDENGRKIRDSYFIRLNAKALVTSYTYNKMGLIELIEDYGGTKTEYKYSKTDKVVEIKKKNEGNIWLEVYTYDKQDKLVKVEKYNNKKLYETLNYDGNGNLIAPKSNVVLEELDEQKNWVKRVKLNHGIHFYIERTIEYFD